MPHPECKGFTSPPSFPAAHYGTGGLIDHGFHSSKSLRTSAIRQSAKIWRSSPKGLHDEVLAVVEYQCGQSQGSRANEATGI
ncbi:hypothetical protein SNOG_14753 [Parastagonospora nodorum SN15]|uniref:Uncharacterized protein n=1 Tax=Phaeosphaeria nodorum (strain SN15 / ATCC MYA-4574 / FGSC 10173) TaxID=321614 RepID=Q0U0N7_PHANO|nr:hypothetical protein SNOG_14753 [Parastagonospora nodorum SN15]EAT77945.1 hypothetical protein SNOG_14753 [Parastagonospora nodorum SN15]